MSVISRYRYNGKEKRCWVYKESTENTYEKAIEDFALCYYDVPDDAFNEETFEEEDGSFSYQYELPKIKEFSTKAIFKHGETELTIEQLASNIISCTLRNVKNPIITVWHWPNVIEDKEGFPIDIDSPDYGMTVWDPEKEVYKTETGLPKIFNFYWDEYNIDYDFLFYFEFNIHSVDKDKDEKKPYFYYGWDFTPAIASFIHQTLDPYIEYRKGTEKEVEEVKKDFEDWNRMRDEAYGSQSKKRDIRTDRGARKKLNGLKKKIIQIIGQNGEAIRPWKVRGYKTSYWRHISWGDYPKELKESQKELGNEFFELIQMTPYNEREKTYKHFADIARKEGNEKKALQVEWLWETEKLEIVVNGKGKILYVPKQVFEYDFGLETKENWIKREGELPGLVISFLPTMFHGRKVKRDEKLTGTKWFEKLWEVFGQHGVPIVLRCYEGFVYKNLQLNHREWWNKISAITNLPPCINGRETLGSNMLVYFNCPWLEKEGVDGTINRIKWDPKIACDKLKYRTFFRCWFKEGMTWRQLYWMKNPRLDPRFEDFKDMPDWEFNELVSKIIQKDLENIGK